MELFEDWIMNKLNLLSCDSFKIAFGRTFGVFSFLLSIFQRQYTKHSFFFFGGYVLSQS